MSSEPVEDVKDALSENAQDKELSLDEMLRLLQRVVAAAHTSIVITDPTQPDNPIIFHNKAFENITGYNAQEIDGHNCRFLQGPDTDPATVKTLRDAIQNAEPCRVEILNYRKDGEPFWNELFVSPVPDNNGSPTHFVGVQNDVTLRAEAERERDHLLSQQQRITETLQRALLLDPPSNRFHGLSLSVQYEPALEEAQFGGDFWDVFAVNDDKVALIVGDLTGKGLQAAQHTAEVKYALRVLLREYSHPTPTLHRLNAFLSDALRLDGRDEYALTCVTVAVLETASGNVQVVAAGMEPPLVLRADGNAQAIDTHGLMIGADPHAKYHTQSLTLEQGDRLLLFTDGLTEARSPRRRFYGYEGVIEAAKATANLATLDEMSRQMVDEAKAFAGGKLQDDVCLLVALRTISSASVISPGEKHVTAASDAMTEAEESDLARFALEVTGLGYWEIDTATGATRRSLRHDQIFGHDAPLSLWTYEQFLSHIHPEDRAFVDALYGQALASGTDWNFKCRIVRPSGQIAWIESRGKHFRARDNDSPRIIGTVRDITEHREARARQDFLADLNRRVRSLREPQAVVRETVESVGKFLNLSRYMYADVNEDQGIVHVTDEYRVEQVSPQVGISSLAEWGSALDEMRHGATLVVDDTWSDARLAGDMDRYKHGDIRAFVAVPLFRGGRWAAVFSAHQSDQPRVWTAEEIKLLEAVAAQMWVVLEEARLIQSEKEQAARQRKVLRDVLKSLTEGRLFFCLTEKDLPTPLTSASQQIALTLPTLRLLRKKVQAVSDDVQLPLERSEDLETAVGEAAMNAVVHGGSGVGEVCADDETGQVQVWIRDQGKGISDEAFPQMLQKGTSSAGTLGHGFWLMLKTCDRIYLLTGASGTTVVLEQDRTAPSQAWFESYS